MIWILIIIAIFFVSLGLAYRSMTNFRETPNSKIGYGLFLIQNKANFTSQTLVNLSQHFQKPQIVSFEVARKDENQALLIYGPKNLAEVLVDLNLLELEDYTHRLNSDLISVGEIAPKRSSSKTIEVSGSFLDKIKLNGGDELFFQAIVRIGHSTQTSWATTARLIVNADAPLKRTEIWREINFRLSHISHLSKRLIPRATFQLFEDYQKRAFYPEESSQMNLTSSDLIALLGN